jgi:hypothetical protein
MTVTTREVAPTRSSALTPRRPAGTNTEPWREAITDYRPPAGPDGCWASDGPRVPGQDAGPGSS